MLSREQIYAMLMIRNREDTIFSEFPVDLIREISVWANSDISQALQYAAYARKEDVIALIKMLEDNPRLLCQAADVKTPGGDEIRNVTIYELVLGAGDYELAKMVQPYFSKIKDGKKHQIKQYELYRPHIEVMLKQKSYDLTPLIDLIKQASADDVTALLNNDMTRNGDLCKAIMTFRNEWQPRILTEPCMHYNYASLQHAFTLLDREWDNLYETSGNDYDKIRLVWWKLIGFEMRRLPGIDRCVMAQGLHSVIKKQEVVARSYIFKGSDEAFPIIVSDDSVDDPDSDFSFEILAVEALQHREGAAGCRKTWKDYFGELMSNKNVKLSKLMLSQQGHQPQRCIIL